MNSSAAMAENRGNVMMNIVRRLNAGMIRFLMGIRFRAVGATILGGCAGLSLTTTVIPSALSLMDVTDNFSARWGIGGFAVYAMMLWAVGGWAAQRSGNKWFGAIILGLVGLLSSLVFTGFGIGTEAVTLLSGGVAGLLYGGIGGMLIADSLRNPYDAKNPSASQGRIGDLGIFRYFDK